MLIFRPVPIGILEPEKGVACRIIAKRYGSPPRSFLHFIHGGQLKKTAYLAVVGFAYPGMDELMARFNMPGRMYPEVSLLSLLWGPAVVVLGAMIAAIYPALRLFRLAPVQAMRAV